MRVVVEKVCSLCKEMWTAWIDEGTSGCRISGVGSGGRSDTRLIL